ncbi:hypothetical protein LDL08_32490 [Nonomuraea glycinis]|nr:hypothetical protein [Nonomuraea glycinis]MCA2180909.1 hypothetical protein [Nonomuraea glycinis]
MVMLGCDLDALRVMFPGWSFFVSDEGVFYATRRGAQLSYAEIAAGLHQTVSGDDPATIAAALQDQARMAVMA